jgi:O-antigen/teichoic acid export membrane protein
MVESAVAKNTVANILSNFIPAFINLLVIMYATRRLAQANINDYYVAVGFLALFITMMDLGVSMVFVRESARNGFASFQSYASLKFVLTGGVSLISIAVLWFMPYEWWVKEYVIILILTQFVSQACVCISSVFQSVEKMEYAMYGHVVQSIVYGLLAYVALSTGGRVAGLLVASLLSFCVWAAYYYYAVVETGVKLSRKFDWKGAKKLAVVSATFIVLSLSGAFYENIGRFLLTVYSQESVAGYSLAYTVVVAITSVVSSLTGSLYPSLSKRDDVYSVRVTYRTGLRLLLSLFIPLCLGTAMVGGSVVLWLFPGYVDAVSALQIMVWVLPFAAFGGIGGTILVSRGRERVGTVPVVACSLATVVLCILLLPSTGIVGASAIYVGVNGVVYSAIIWYALKEYVDSRSMFEDAGRILLASFAMGAVIYLVHPGNVFLSVGIGVASYFIAARFFNVYDPADISYVVNGLKSCLPVYKHK